jgi:hypothetical protein
MFPAVKQGLETEQEAPKHTYFHQLNGWKL